MAENAFIHLKNNQAPKLIIFTHAGALPIQYINWTKGLLQDNFDIYISSPSPKNCQNWQELIEFYSEEFHQIVDEKSMILGHSMGSLVAYQLLLKYESKLPKLCLSAIAPLSNVRIQYYKKIAQLSAEEFTKTLKDFGGIPDYLSSQVELMARYVQDIRKDFQLLASATAFSEKIATKMTVLGGNNDQIATLSDLNAWKHRTSKDFDLKVFTGGHFYIFDQNNQVNHYLLDLYQS